MTNNHLLRPPLAGIFLRSFPLHSPRYARETIAEIGSMRDALATAIISQTGSWATSIMADLRRGGADRPPCQVRIG